MKQLKFLSTLGIAFVFLFSSCSGNENKTTDTTVTNDSTAITSNADSMATTATPESTVTTTPENIIVIWQKVADFAKWKMAYDGHDSARMASSIHNYVIGRSIDDSNNVLVALKADDIAKAKTFAKDPGLKAAMQKGGVKGAPSIFFTTVVYQDMSKNMSDFRSMMMFKVKDWDAWKKTFESNRQVRTDNGFTDRAYGYDADDNHKVILVVAINDTAKANAYWKSDLFKQKKAESGVVGDVKKYTYHVVQKY